MITTMHSDQNASPPRVEVITSVQRRRRWPTAEKSGLNGLERAMRTAGDDHADPVIAIDDAACDHDSHKGTLQCRRASVPVLGNRASKPFSKSFDFKTRRAQASDFDNGGMSKPQQRALRQGRQINLPRGDILSQVAWPHVKSRRVELFDQFTLYEVQLS